MKSSLGDAIYLGTARVTTPEAHQLYNAWQRLDHLPENLALDGVNWGERWVLSPDCAAVSSRAPGEWSVFQYMTTYWFRPPVADAIDEWAGLADASVQWGRRPELRVTERPFLGFFRPVLGQVAPRALVSPAALPTRPNRGVVLTVTRSGAVTAEARADIEERYAWYARQGFPAWLQHPGVAGVWAFASAPDLAPAAWAAQEGADRAPGASASLRVHLLYCDGDPVDVARSFATGDGGGSLIAPGEPLEEVLFAGPLRHIPAWTWDWFDADMT